MASFGRKQGMGMVMATATNLLKTLNGKPSNFRSNTRSLSGVGSSEVVTSHTDKWMQDTSKKSPMELINEVPPIKVEGRIAACEGDTNPALGHPIEYICLDLPEPAVCKYCGLRFVQDHHH
ncbi:hypothetical protein RND71_030395 [Anisodus tanguticus]|uniref:Zinc finger CHCC-type domain-containing protein n=1 Tax=Anisodus tanguticus TaxID=243964 RepID=A0AAE1V109_9SOLA|nr:hypothetical protein RND71_030395 [Anisodus tanguticus]